MFVLYSVADALSSANWFTVFEALKSSDAIVIKVLHLNNFCLDLGLCSVADS